MKLLKAVFLFGIISYSSPTLAADGSSGCGLGWQLLTKNSLLSSFSRTITHAFLPNSFSMTFGTSGCSKHSIVMKDKRSLHFVEANMDQLQNQVAQGSGVYLEAFSHTLGCSADVSGEFAQAMQAHYQYLFPSITPASAGEVLANVKTVVGYTPNLAFSCRDAA